MRVQGRAVLTPQNLRLAKSIHEKVPVTEIREEPLFLRKKRLFDLFTVPVAASHFPKLLDISNLLTYSQIYSQVIANQHFIHKTT